MPKNQLFHHLKTEIKELIDSSKYEKVYVYDVTDYRLTKEKLQEGSVPELWLSEDFYIFNDFLCMIDSEFVVSESKIHDSPLFEMQLD